ncbi:hypothetical protein DPMN_045811 [Dreissena polymorpha]|uniref:Uncharacterized protein n=1 Tax=Dreissena polymorpha TaxID=45954 RepID=A0A9D4HZY9_DREPO|nr:hypothetical protein DPMN_045811 [Dreissena polymorpha]
MKLKSNSQKRPQKYCKTQTSKPRLTPNGTSQTRQREPPNQKLENHGKPASL